MQSVIQRSFAGGELSESVSARADQVKYQTGLRVCRNAFVRKEGGISIRMGTRMIAEAKDSEDSARFLYFIYNDAQTYILEAGDGYFRFYREGARIVVSGVAPWDGGTAYGVGDIAARLGVNYYCVSGHTNQVPPNGTYWHPLDGAIYEIPTPYTIAQVIATDPRLMFFQRGDVVTITHPEHDVRELRRTGHTSWTLVTVTYAPSIAAPANVTNDGAPGSATQWVVTAVDAETFEESLASSVTSSADAPDASGITVSWDAVTGAGEYNLYREVNGVFGFIGVAGGLAYIDIGAEPDVSVTAPTARNPFAGAGNQPAVGGMYQQRRIFANMLNNVERVEGSRSGLFSNFSRSSPLQDDDSISFTVAGNRVNAIRHLLEMDRLVIMTAGAIYKAQGNADGVLVATQPPNLEKVARRGASTLPPIEVDNAVLYGEARGDTIRDLRPDVVKGHAGRDLTVFAAHLFRGRSIQRWGYAENPHSIVNVVRSDGVMLGLTYLPEHEIWGWHRHDTLGEFEDVACVPEGGFDATYAIVRRTINGVSKVFIERFADPFIEETADLPLDMFFVDCGLTYNGRNAGAVTMTLTADQWTPNDEITIESSAAFFTVDDVGNAIVCGDETERATVIISEFTDTTHVLGFATTDVPASLRNTALTSWGKAVDRISGLDHLEGEAVAVLGDGNVLSSPNNPEYPRLVVESGTVTLDRPYLIIHAGLPFVSDGQTLDLDRADATIRDRLKNVSSISLLVEATRGLYVGQRFPEDIPEAERVDPLDLTEGMTEEAPPFDADADTIPLTTARIEIGIQSTWEDTGRVCWRQTEPLPYTILAAIPSGEVGG